MEIDIPFLSKREAKISAKIDAAEQQEEAERAAGISGKLLETVASYAPRFRQSETGTSAPVKGGMLLVVLFLVGFMLWAVLAPLQSAAIATDIITGASNRKPIQHLEGGIVDQVMVQNGAVVAAGDILIKIDDTRARASLEVLRVQHRAASARLSRLAAERDGLPQIRFDDWLLEADDDPNVAEVLSGQTRIFDNGHKSLVNSTAVLDQRVKQFQAEIVGLKAQISAGDSQLLLIKEEIRDLEALVAKGLARKPKLLALQRQAAEIEGKRGENLANIAKAEQNITESELRKIELRNEFDSRAAQEYRDTQTELFDLMERLDAAEDVYRRTVVIAPYAGTVINLAFHSPGQVIGAGQPVLDLVPAEDELVVEARILPEDIDVVSPGMSAEIRLTALKQRNAPIIRGSVMTVSADSLEDDRTGDVYYLARVRLSDAQENILNEIQLYPGMQSEVLILTGESTMLDYLLNPLTGAFRRGMREETQ